MAKRLDKTVERQRERERARAKEVIQNLEFRKREREVIKEFRKIA